MLILDWRHPSLYCGSLGNITACAFGAEYIYDKLNIDIGVLIGEYHKEIWKLCIPLNRILYYAPKDEEVRICCPEERLDKDCNLYHWVQNPVECAGFHMPDYDLIDPKIVWLHSINSRRVLLYPREYNNQNLLFNTDYWMSVINLLKSRGWRIICILDDKDSHRDGETSLNWCNEFRNKIEQLNCCDYIFPPTIGGLQAGVGLSEIAFGILSGPFWVMLKSTIRQIVISDPNDLILSHNATYNLKFVKKCITHILGTSLDWINEL